MLETTTISGFGNSHTLSWGSLGQFKAARRFCHKIHLWHNVVSYHKIKVLLRTSIPRAASRNAQIPVPSKLKGSSWLRKWVRAESMSLEKRKSNPLAAFRRSWALGWSTLHSAIILSAAFNLCGGLRLKWSGDWRLVSRDRVTCRLCRTCRTWSESNWWGQNLAKNKYI